MYYIYLIYRKLHFSIVDLQKQNVDFSLFTNREKQLFSAINASFVRFCLHCSFTGLSRSSLTSSLYESY